MDETRTVDDVCVVEDDASMMSALAALFEDEDVNYVIIPDLVGFREYLSSGKRAERYYLDDQIPEHDGSGEVVPAFLRLYLELSRVTPSSQQSALEVYCTTGKPFGQVERFCRNNGIELVPKWDIVDHYLSLQEQSEDVPASGVVPVEANQNL